MHKCGLCHHAVSVCPSVHLSITFVYSVETNRHVFTIKIFSPSGSHTLLVFLDQLHPDVCHIAPKMLYIHSLIGVSHSAK